jgi:protein SCO1/2
MERKFFWVGTAILLVLVIAVGAAYLTRDRSYRGVRYNPPKEAYDFTLESADGAQVHLHDFRGKLALIFFGFTHCDEICPTTLAILKQVKASLGSQASQVQVIYITVDPLRDTPQVIQENASAFDPSFIGLSGSEEALQPVWEAYGVFRELPADANSMGHYEVTHSTRLYLIDAQGRLFLSFDYGTPPADILHDVRLVLGK